MPTKFLSLPFIHYASRRFGWPSLKQKALDAMFTSGKWVFPKESPTLVELVESVAKGGRVVMLGSGSNPLGKAMHPFSYSIMHGVDLSPEAVALANNDAPPRQYFQVGDMTTFTVVHQVNAVVFAESIYYMEEKHILPVLKHWQSKLLPKGSIIVTLATPDRWSKITDIIHDNFTVYNDEPLTEGHKRTVLVFN